MAGHGRCGKIKWGTLKRQNQLKPHVIINNSVIKITIYSLCFDNIMNLSAIIDMPAVLQAYK
jgi:hypothetical protein